MNKDGSNPTVIPTPKVTWLANATNTVITGGNFVSVSMGDVNLQHPMTIQRSIGDSPDSPVVSRFTKELGLDLLSQHIAPGAIHNSAERYDPPKCLPRTRGAILRKIMAWVEMRAENMELFLWLYGSAGTGKSAIAQTIAEICEQAGLLAASFFLSRTAAGRNDMSRLVSTIVYQLVQTIPEIRDRVLTLLGKDPHILSQAPSSQMRTLVTDPLNTLAPTILAERPGFIIIDGLDECGHPDSQREILKLVAGGTSQLKTLILFLIASRVEPIIRLTFNSDILKFITGTIPLQHSYETREDLRHYLHTKFQEVKATHPMQQHIPLSWPSEDDIEALVNNATGQFIYSATVVRYVQSSHHRPEDRLATILAVRSDEDEPFASVDSLYLQILSSVDKGRLEKVLDILGCLVFVLGEGHDYIKGSTWKLDEFLCYRPGDVDILVSDLHSVIYFPPPDQPRRAIRIYHQSFCDFLIDRGRAREFFLDSQTIEARLVCRWIPYMEKHHICERCMHICRLSVPTF